MAKEQHQVELLASCTTEGNLTASISLNGGAQSAISWEIAVRLNFQFKWTSILNMDPSATLRTVRAVFL